MDAPDTRPMIRLAIYDMDKTVTRRPTYTPFLIHAARTRKPWRLLLLPFVAVTILLYALWLIDRARLKELNHALLIGGTMSPAEAEALAHSFAAETLATNILPGAQQQIATDKNEGYRMVMATASYEFYSRAIGAALGFDHIIGTLTRTDASGALLARIAEQNCYGTSKLEMVEAWMAREGLTRADCHIRFYSDHISDAPCLNWADEAFATNAHPPLVELATQRGWTVSDWR
jgi:HAD superfamily hydrolase (TIGR01490 family)